MMKPLFIVAALAAATSANAAVLFSEDFDSITANTLNIGPGNAITMAASMDVFGEVDAVVPINPYGINGLTSTVIDLDGTSGPGAVGKSGFNLVAGRTYTLDFLASGAQRRSVSDSLYVTLLSSAGSDLKLLGGTGLFSFLGGGVNLSSTFTATNTAVAGDTPFTASSLTFLANNSTSFGFLIGTNSADNIGPLLDSVTLTSNVVPEPATWAMLIAGFGLVGTAMRRRGAAVAA